MAADDILTQGILLDVTVFPQKFNGLSYILTFINDVADYLEMVVESVSAHKVRDRGFIVTEIGDSGYIVVSTRPANSYIQIDISTIEDFDPDTFVGFLRDAYGLTHGYYSCNFRGQVPPLPDLVEKIEDME